MSKIFVLYQYVNDYDQPDCPVVIFSEKPTIKELKLLFKDAEEVYITTGRLKKLLEGDWIYNTKSGEKESHVYHAYCLQEHCFGEWL